MTARWTGTSRADQTRRCATDDQDRGDCQRGTTASDIDQRLATRYWLTHSWVEVLPEGTCYIVPYGDGSVDTGMVAAATEAALAEVADRIDWGVPLVRTGAWADPNREIPALDRREQFERRATE